MVSPTLAQREAAKLPSPCSPIAGTRPGTTQNHPVGVGGGTPSRRGRSAGLQTGIAATGRETPTAMFAACRNPSGDGAETTQWVWVAGRHPEGVGTPVFRPASRPQAAKLPPPCSPIAGTRPGTAQNHPVGVGGGTPSRRGRSAGLQTGIAAKGRETPIARFADCRNPSGDNAEPPSGGGWRDAIQKGQERRSSDRHRGQRPRNSHRHVRRLPEPVRGRRRTTQWGWVAGRHPEGAGAPVFRPASRPKAAKLPSPCSPIAGTRPGTTQNHPVGVGGGTPSRRGRNAGLQTGIAAKGRETPTAMFAACRNPSGDGAEPPSGCGWRDAIQKGQERRSSDRHRGQRPRNSHRHVRRLPEPVRGQRRTTQWVWVAGRHPEGAGAPVFTPASRPKAAKLPPPCSPLAGTRPGTTQNHPVGVGGGTPSRRGRSAGLHTGIAAKGRETPIARFADCRNPSGDDAEPPSGGGWRDAIQKGQERRSSDRHRGQRPRNSHRSVRRLPEPVRGQRRTTQWGWVAGRHPEGVGTPVFRPASRPKAAKLPPLCSPLAGTRPGTTQNHPVGVGGGTPSRRGRSAGLQTGIAAKRPRNSHRHVRRLPEPVRGRRTAVRTRGWRCAMLVACCAMQRSDDGSFARCAGDAGLKTGAPGGAKARSADSLDGAGVKRHEPCHLGRGRARSAGAGTPVFRPASRPEAAKLPSLCSPLAGTRPGTAQNHPVGVGGGTPSPLDAAPCREMTTGVSPPAGAMPV